MMLITCAACKFKGYVEDYHLPLCNGCRHDQASVDRVETSIATRNDDHDDMLGNEFWAEYLEMMSLDD